MPKATSGDMMPILASVWKNRSEYFLLLMKIITVIVIGISIFAWGMVTMQFHVFPWNYVSSFIDSGINVIAFVRGDATETTSVYQKLLNDFDISPERHIRHYSPQDPAAYRELPVRGLRNRRNLPRVWTASPAIDRYWLVVGAFDFSDAFWGAILFNSNGDILKQWKLSGEIESLTDKPDRLKDLYGFAVFPDGSMAFTMQEPSGGLIKVDACSKLQWIKKGKFHHVISPTEDWSAFWTFGGMQVDLHPKLLLIDAGNGATLKEIDMAEVARVNSDIFIFDLQRTPNVKDATHPNDIEPLPASLVDKFPGFSAGDLLVSYHTTNLIFVLDPKSLRIKWWYLGAGDGQHDPDWEPDGTISVFNNKFRANDHDPPEFSSIVSIDPSSRSHRILVDGSRYDWYTWFNGLHQITDYRSVLITSSTQGRVFETDLETGKVLFDFVNSYNWDEGRSLHLSGARAVDSQEVKKWMAQKCQQGEGALTH